MTVKQAKKDSRTEMVTAYLTPEEKRRVERRAEDEYLSVSDLIRRLLMRSVQDEAA